LTRGNVEEFDTFEQLDALGFGRGFELREGKGSDEEEEGGGQLGRSLAGLGGEEGKGDGQREERQSHNSQHQDQTPTLHRRNPVPKPR